MVLYEGEALIVSSSTKILFFKVIVDRLSNISKWTHYHTLYMRGSISYLKESYRIIITTTDYIYLYKINRKTFEPELENVMYNFMQCN